MIVGNQQKFQELMNQGHSAAWDQAWEKAASYYRQAVMASPEHAGAHSSLALALFELEDFDNALVHYKKALEISPEDPMPLDKIARIQERQGMLPEAIRTYLQVAELYIKNRDVEKAIESWNRILSLKPDHLNARTRLAMVHERRGKKAEAVEEYLVTASIMQHQGEVQRAIQVAEYCLQIIPEHARARNALAQLRSNQLLPKPMRPRGGTGPIRMAQVKKMQESTEGDTKLRSPIQEAHHKALIRIASLLFDQADLASEDRPTQRRDLSSIARGDGSLVRDQARGNKAMLHLGQAIDAQTRNDDNQTLVELEKALDTGLDHPAVHYIVGEIYAKKESKKALKHLQSSLGHADFALGAQLLMGQYHFNLANYRDATSAYLNALASADSATVSPKKADEIRQLYEPIIETQTQQEDDDALRKLCQNIDRQLNRPDWLGNLTTLRKQLPDSEGASLLPLADLLLSSSSYVVDAITRIRELAARQLYYSATEEAFFTLDKAPTFLPLHILIGELLLQQGKTHDAVSKFTLVANLYDLRGESSQAIRMLERVTKMAPMNLKIRTQLVEKLVKQGQIMAAVEQLKQMADIYYQLAELDKTRQTYSDAIRLLQQSRADRSTLLDLLYRKADIDMQHLDFRQAIRVYEQIRTIEPQDIKARIRLIDLYFRLGQDSAAINELDSYINLLEDGGKRPKILQFLQDLVGEVPDKLEIRKRLADHMLKSGKKSEAIEQLDMIADALLNMGNRDAALRVLKTIIALKPANLQDYQQAYAQLSKK